jgi:hypothetical protein
MLSMLTPPNTHTMLGMTGWVVFSVLPNRPPLRDVYVRGVRGDLWDWLYAWKERMSYGAIINVLLEEWQKLDESERRRILLEHRPPD